MSGKNIINHMAKTRTATLAKARQIEFREYDLPQVKEDEILVKVEGCGICGTDVHEFKGEPFGIAPLVLGHEGTGEIVALGKNVTVDTQGKPVKVGDKVVSSILVCGHCPSCLRFPEKPNLCSNLGVYGLISDDDFHLNGWFANHILLRKGSTFFEVNKYTLDERMLLEPACVVVHALERAKTVNIMNFSSFVLVQGCGPIGLLQIAVLKAYGIENIIALDSVAKRLDMAKKMGASFVINAASFDTIEKRVAEVQRITGGYGVDFAFQCTGNPVAASEVFKYIRRGGGLCELGFFVDNGSTTYNPHQDFCNKEITVVGSWVYSAQEYLLTMSFMNRAKTMNIPVAELVTDKFTLDEIVKAMETNIAMSGLKVAIVI